MVGTGGIGGCPYFRGDFCMHLYATVTVSTSLERCPEFRAATSLYQITFYQDLVVSTNNITNLSPSFAD